MMKKELATFIQTNRRASKLLISFERKFTEMRYHLTESPSKTVLHGCNLIYVEMKQRLNAATWWDKKDRTSFNQAFAYIKKRWKLAHNSLHSSYMKRCFYTPAMNYVNYLGKKRPKKQFAVKFSNETIWANHWNSDKPENVVVEQTPDLPIHTAQVFEVEDGKETLIHTVYMCKVQ